MESLYYLLPFAVVSALAFGVLIARRRAVHEADSDRDSAKSGALRWNRIAAVACCLSALSLVGLGVRIANAEIDWWKGLKIWCPPGPGDVIPPVALIFGGTALAWAALGVAAWRGRVGATAMDLVGATPILPLIVVFGLATSHTTYRDSAGNCSQGELDEIGRRAVGTAPPIGKFDPYVLDPETGRVHKVGSEDERARLLKRINARYQARQRR